MSKEKNGKAVALAGAAVMVLGVALPVGTVNALAGEATPDATGGASAVADGAAAGTVEQAKAELDAAEDEAAAAAKAEAAAGEKADAAAQEKADALAAEKDAAGKAGEARGAYDEAGGDQALDAAQGAAGDAQSALGQAKDAESAAKTETGDAQADVDAAAKADAEAKANEKAAADAVSKAEGDLLAADSELTAAEDAQAKIEAAEQKAAREEAEKAQAALDAAKGKVDKAQQVAGDAQAKADASQAAAADAKDALGTAEGKLDAADAALKSADADASAAQEAAEAAKSQAAADEAAADQAGKDLLAAKDAKTAADEGLTAADAEKAAADKALAAAQDKASAAKADAEAAHEKNSLLGFYDWMLKQDGLTDAQRNDLTRARKVIEDAAVEDFSLWYGGDNVNLGGRGTNVTQAADPNDAVSLDYLQDCFAQMRRVNELRASDDNFTGQYACGEAKTNFYFMAVAATGADRGAGLLRHSKLQVSCENLAWWFNPADQWYSEKSTFDQIKAELGIETIDAAAVKQINAEAEKRDVAVGHYTNLFWDMGDGQVMAIGMAHYRGNSSKGRTWCFNASKSSNYETGYALYTIDEAEALVNKYRAALDVEAEVEEKAEALEKAETALSKAQDAQAEAAAALGEAQAAAGSAEEAVAKAQDAYDDAIRTSCAWRARWRLWASRFRTRLRRQKTAMKKSMRLTPTLRICLSTRIDCSEKVTAASVGLLPLMRLRGCSQTARAMGRTKL